WRLLARRAVFQKGRTTRMLFQFLRRRTLCALGFLFLSGVALTCSEAAAQTLGTADIQSILQGVTQPTSSAPTQPTNTLPTTPQTLTPTVSTPAAPPVQSAPSGLETQFS